MCAASQVSSRAVTFVLNLVITRMLTPEAYGVRIMLQLLHLILPIGLTCYI